MSLCQDIILNNAPCDSPEPPFSLEKEMDPQDSGGFQPVDLTSDSS